MTNKSCTRCGKCCIHPSGGACALRSWHPIVDGVSYEFMGRCEFLLEDNRCDVIATILSPPDGVVINEESLKLLGKLLRGVCTGEDGDTIE